MLNVLIDHQKFSTQRYGGISRYYATIIDGIRQDPTMHCQLGVLSSPNHYIRHIPLPLRNPVGNLLQRKANYNYKLNQWYCTKLLERQKFDIFHPTYYDTYFIKSLRKPLVVTVYDMTYELMPEYFWAQDPLTYQKRINMERADALIAISETTKKDMLAFHDIDPGKIHVIHLGIEQREPVQSQPVSGLPANYVLYVGDRSGYKNFYLFMRAYQQIAARYPELDLMLVGGGGMAIAEKELIHRMGLSNRVRHLNASDEQLVYLYQHARLFVYPSLYEGFGLPVLEAFQANCPMLLSDIPSFQEVAGEAAVYFEATSVESLVNEFDALLNDTARQQALVAAGQQRLRQFTLEASVQKTLNLYKSMV